MIMGFKASHRRKQNQPIIMAVLYDPIDPIQKPLNYLISPVFSARFPAHFQMYIYNVDSHNNTRRKHKRK